MPPKPPSTAPAISTLLADLDRFEEFLALAGKSTTTARLYRRHTEVILSGLYQQGHKDLSKVREADLVKALAGTGPAGFNAAWSGWRAWVAWAKVAGYRVRVPTPSAKEARDLAQSKPGLRNDLFQGFHVPPEAIPALRRFLFLSEGGLGVPLAAIPTLTRGSLARRTLSVLDDKGAPIPNATVRHAVVLVPRGTQLDGSDADVEVFRPRSDTHAAFVERAMQTYLRLVFPEMNTPDLAKATRRLPLIPDSEDGRRHITLPRLLQLVGLARTLAARDSHAALELHRTQEIAASHDFPAALADALAQEADEIRRAKIHAVVGGNARGQADRDPHASLKRDAKRRLKRGVEQLGERWFDMPGGVPLEPAQATKEPEKTARPAASAAGSVPAPGSVCVPPSPRAPSPPPAKTISHPRDLPFDDLDQDLADL